MPDDEDAKREPEHEGPRPFWSGVLAFGLVSLPVSLFPAHRGNDLSLKMVASDGTPLRRRYFCPRDEEALASEEIVRGYEVEPDHYVVVEDEELEALAPERSREIDLRRFVELDEIDPVYFERGYFLAPDGDTTKAYRLLATSMEAAGRAGIATFVMRDKEYLVAILSENGILRAETLRFHDELRSPEDVGLPELGKPEKADGALVSKAIRDLAEPELRRSELGDPQVRRLRELIERKIEAGEDVVEMPEESEESGEGAEVIDLMQVLKERLQGRKPAPDTDELEELGKDELYERARERDVSGRSRMSKRQLIEALRKRR